MPELPEVETIRIGLNKLLIGRVITNLSYDNLKSFPENVDLKDHLINAKVVKIRRRGKVLIIELDNKYSLVIHLKMTGQLVFQGEQKFGAGHPSDSLINPLPDKSTRVIISFKDKSKLFFNDQRKFGWVRLMPFSEVKNLDFFKRIGPEPLSSKFTAEEFYERLIRRVNSRIKTVLIDQTIIAGIGNIYADESLWGARIHPSTLVKDLSKKDVINLFKAVRSVLRLSIEKGGSTDRNYVDAEGRKGSYLKFAQVFRLQGNPCPRCGTTIVKIRVAGRGTHICPNCQKLVTK